LYLPALDACARYARKRVKRVEDIHVADLASSLLVLNCSLTLRKTSLTAWRGRIFIMCPILPTVTGIPIIQWVAGF